MHLLTMISVLAMLMFRPALIFFFGVLQSFYVKSPSYLQKERYDQEISDCSDILRISLFLYLLSLVF